MVGPDISSAQQAITRIETIRELYDCKILYSSRPYGFRILKDFFTNLNILYLAGFSLTQQKSFVEKWYSKWASLQKEIYDPNFSKTQSDNFIKELHQAGDLKKIAETPLLLSILIVQKMQDAKLPKSKLEALKEITQYLIKKHPVKRISDAGIVEDNTSDIDFKDIFCELAINIQKESNDGVILKSEAQKIIQEYLITYAEYNRAKAKVYSEKLLEVGANNFGIIIEKSNDEISFGHKQFQEFLAAQYLYESDEDEVNEFIKQYAADPTFHQVIISLFGLIQLKQVKKYRKHYSQIKKADKAPYQEQYLELISYEIALALGNAPSDIMNHAFDSIIYHFEFETDPKYKEALLKRILNALHNGRLKERVEDYLIQYFPNQNKYRDYRVNALRYTNLLNTTQVEYLKKVFINGSIELRHDASYVFKKHIMNEEVLSFLKGVISNCSNPGILSFAINSIATDDLEEQQRDELIKSIEANFPIVQLYLFKHKVLSKKHSQDDLELIIPIINQIPYQLKKEAIDLLIDGFNQNGILKDIIIKSISKKGYYNEEKNTIDKTIAWKVLFHSFNKDKDAINLIKSQFENEEYPFTSQDNHELFGHLNYYFKGNDELIPAIENWLKRRLEKHSLINPEVAFASIFVHSEYAKKILIQYLPKRGISHWNVMALLEGWPNDKEIQEQLKEYFRTIEKSKTSYSAQFIPKIFDSNEKTEAIKILEEILFDKKITFRERAISALVAMDKEYFENNLLKKLLEDLETFPKDGFSQYYTAIEEIAKNFHSNKAVQDYILERIENDNSFYSLSVRHFPERIYNEEKLLQKSIPLLKELRLLIIEALATYQFCLIKLKQLLVISK